VHDVDLVPSADGGTARGWRLRPKARCAMVIRNGKKSVYVEMNSRESDNLARVIAKGTDFSNGLSETERHCFLRIADMFENGVQAFEMFTE
jgi:hypothetical protein